MPVLWDKDRGRIVNDESGDILRMLATVFDPLATRDAPRGASARSAMAPRATGRRAGSTAARPVADPQSPELRTHGEGLLASLDRFEALLEERDFLAGQTFGILDLAVFPFLKYGVGAFDEDDEVFHRILVEHLRLEAKHHRLQAWMRVWTPVRARGSRHRRIPAERNGY